MSTLNKESKCPFHENSAGKSLRGEIESINCPHCGTYRISKTALDGLKAKFAGVAPQGWREVLSSRGLISTRDTRSLHA